MIIHGTSMDFEVTVEKKKRNCDCAWLDPLWNGIKHPCFTKTTDRLGWLAFKDWLLFHWRIGLEDVVRVAGLMELEDCPHVEHPFFRRENRRREQCGLPSTFPGIASLGEALFEKEVTDVMLKLLKWHCFSLEEVADGSSTSDSHLANL